MGGTECCGNGTEPVTAWESVPKVTRRRMIKSERGIPGQRRASPKPGFKGKLGRFREL